MTQTASHDARPAARHGPFLLSVVSPVYNERDNLEPFLRELRGALAELPGSPDTEIVLVDDGSSDGSGELLDEVTERSPGEVTVVHLARNFGLEVAVSAGLDHAAGDAVVVMDSDLQDDPAALAALIAHWRQGYDVVYAVRTSREGSGLRRLAFWSFYRLVKWMANVDLPLDASNFALMDRRVVDRLRSLPERNRYLRGLRAWVGFRQIGVPVARRARSGGHTRLGLRGQWRLAMNGIFSFSTVPLQAFRLAGLVALGVSALLIGYALYAKLVMGIEVQSWASLLVSISFFGGINLLGLGILGEYVARIFDEVRQRPLYVVDRVAGGQPRPRAAGEAQREPETARTETTRPAAEPTRPDAAGPGRASAARRGS